VDCKGPYLTLEEPMRFIRELEETEPKRAEDDDDDAGIFDS
jgi:hypothetical protein